MSFLNSIVADLREKRLWPVALVLLAALVAVPVLLSGKSSPSTPPRAAAATPAHASSLPAVTVKDELGRAHLTGHGRDPFAQGSAKHAKSSAGKSDSSPSSSAAKDDGSAAAGSGDSSSGSSTSGSSSGSSTGSGASTTTTSPTTTTTPTTTTSPTTTTTPTPTPKPPPPGLTGTEAYAVSVGITNDFGGVNTIDPAERLGVLPSSHQPLIVELGVLKGGHRVMFAVAPGTVLNGPGSCIPGPGDCQIMSLATEQNESISQRDANGAAVQVAEFAVTGISVKRYNSAGAASRARRVASTDGEAVLRKADLFALPLFPYKPSLGVVVDERSLQVGDS